MKKTNFFKLLMVGALTLSLGLASCVSKSEFNDVCERLSAVELSIAELTTKLNAVEQGNYVTDVTKVDGKTIKVTYKTGSPVNIELDGIGGPGPGVPAITIGDNGNWYFDGEDSGYSVFGPAPKVENGKWMFPVMTADGVDWEEGEDAIYNAYVTKANGVFTLHIADADGVLQEIPLPSESGGITDIEVLGWYGGFEKGSNNIAPIAATTDFPILYGFVEEVSGEDEGNEGTWTNPGKGGMVEGGMIAVGKNTVLTDMHSTGVGVVVEVYPATATIPEGMAFHNSKGEEVPFVLGKPVNITGYLSRANAANSGLYFIPVAMPATAPSFASAAKFEEKVVEDVAYSLITPDGLKRSSYALGVYPIQIDSYEGAAETLKTTDGEQEIAGGVGIYLNKVYTPTFADIVYNDATAGGGTDIDDYVDIADALSSNAVVDWYFKAAAADIADFGIKFSDNHTKFQITDHPDDVSIPEFDIELYKLGIDGVIYKETITVSVLRTTTHVDPVAIGDYLVWDEVISTTDYLSKPITIDLATMLKALEDQKLTTGGGTTMLSIWEAQVDKYVVSMKVGDDDVWTKFVGNPVKAYNPTEADNKHKIPFVAAATSGAAIGKAPATVGTDATKAGNIGNSIVVGLDKDGNLADAIPEVTGENADIKKFKKIYFVPTYAYNGTGDVPSPSFAFDADGKGKLHTMKIEFFNAAGQSLSSIQATFTPVLPKLNDMFAKAPTFWKDGVLQAYYREPGGTWANTNFFNAGAAPVANGTMNSSNFYNVLNPGGAAHTATAPVDGGYTKAGATLNDGKSWVAYADVAVKDGEVKIGTAKVKDFIATGTPTYQVGVTDATASTIATTIEIKKQTADKPSDIANDAYGKVIDMKWNIGKYLGLYNYTDADKTAQEFKIKIMSALAEGGIGSEADNFSIELTPGTIAGQKIAMISRKNLQMYNYAGPVNGSYNLFRVWDKTAGTEENAANYKYEYTYISGVTFSLTEGASEVEFVGKDGDVRTGTSFSGVLGVEITPATDNADAEIGEAILLKAMATSTGGTGKLKVVIADRFGKTLQREIPITIKGVN